MIEYTCRVCGAQYDEATWRDKDASFNICICCEVEFGVQDTSLEGVVGYRKDWLLAGGKWLNQGSEPENWDLKNQLFNIPLKWWDVELNTQNGSVSNKG